jgi:EAL domain-containing protein (putative c-di-GMP-specific phosphodiesterase class I)
VFIAVLWIVTLSHIDVEREEVVTAQLRQNANLAQALQEHTIRTLKDVEQALAASRYEHVDESRRFDLRRFVEAVRIDTALFTFLGIANERGEVEVGEWVIQESCAQLRAWQDAGLPALPIAVNLSSRQFQQQDVCEVIDRGLAASGIDPSLLEIEITASIAMHNANRTIVTLDKLRTRRIRVAIDDFGTGYSSLSYLKRFPLDSLKLDRSFVCGLPGDAEDSAMARAVITMAHSLDLNVVAEGVETAAQRSFLAAHGCDEMQGYLVSRPVTAAACVPFLRQPDPGAAVDTGSRVPELT